MLNEKVNFGSFKLPKNVHQLVYLEGNLDWENTSNVILNLNEELKVLLPIRLRKKALKIAIEMLDNLVKYHVNQPPDLFIASYTENKLYFLSKNLVENTELLKILYKIIWVNQLEKEALKKEYFSQLKRGKLTELSGAGLGILEMVIKSNNSIQFNVETKNKDLCYLTILVNIDID